MIVPSIYKIGAVIISILLLIGGVALEEHRINTLKKDLEVCNTKYNATQIIIEANKVDYSNNLLEYSKKVVILNNDLDVKLQQIRNMKRRTDETDCQVTYRVLSTHKY